MSTTFDEFYNYLKSLEERIVALEQVINKENIITITAEVVNINENGNNIRVWRKGSKV